jgi:glycogen(starch) synthase
MHVLRLCSVHRLDGDHPPDRVARFDGVGGMQNHTAVLTRELARRGVEQTVLTARSCGPRGTERPVDGVTVHRLGAPFPRFRQLWALDAARVAPGIRPDLVHVHQGEDVAALPLGAALAARAGVPLVVTVHCSVTNTMRPSEPRQHATRIGGALAERAVLPRAAAVITLTGAAARHLAGAIAPDRTHVIPSGVDVDAIQRPRRDPLPDVGRPRVLYVGRLAPQKSVGTLLDAIDLLPTPAQLIVVGTGPDEPALRQRAAASPRAADIRFVGPVPHRDVPAHLQHADVLVLPSRYEELGSVLLEASAAGLPAVASRVGGIPDAVVDGGTGLLATPGDARSFADAIERLLTDVAFRRRCAVGAAAQAERYDWAVLGDRVTEVYARVLRG